MLLGLKPGITHPSLVPMLFASVCRRWRDIVCNTPELWESCWINFFHPELNTIWLSRAGASLLNLHGGSYGPITRGIGWDQFILSILPFQKRWKSLELDTSMVHDVGFIPQLDTPELKTIKIGNFTRTLPLWVINLLRNATQLQSLELPGVTFGTTFGPEILNHHYFPHLSTLRLRIVDAMDVIYILDGLPMLQHFSIRFSYSGATRRERPSVIHTHKNLIFFEIARNMSHVLDYVTFPSLRTFHCKSHLDSDIFLAFLDRSHCSLTSLKIADSLLGDEELIKVLRHDSIRNSTQSLDLTSCLDVATQRLFEFLRYRPGNEHLPHLDQLLIDSCNFEEGTRRSLG